MILRIDGEVGEEMIDQLIQAHNECPQEEGIQLYFTSTGGSLFAMETIVDIINESEKIEIVKAYGELYSGGFFIPMFITKPVEFLEQSVGMIHTAWFPNAPIYSNRTIHKHAEECYEKMFEGSQKLTDTIEKMKILNKVELKRFKNNEDVYLSVERLREMRDIIWQPIQKQIDEIISQYQEEEESVEYLLEMQEVISKKLKNKLSTNN